jgi:hypothetical protein
MMSSLRADVSTPAALSAAIPIGILFVDSDPTRISDLERKLTRSSFAENDVLGFGNAKSATCCSESDSQFRRGPLGKHKH